jgi:hypothetical protein
MQAGFAIIADDNSVALRYGDNAGKGEHGSLAYGVAWCSLGTPGRYGAVTCSFYDRSVHVWEPDWSGGWRHSSLCDM